MVNDFGHIVYLVSQIGEHSLKIGEAQAQGNEQEVSLRRGANAELWKKFNAALSALSNGYEELESQALDTQRERKETRAFLESLCLVADEGSMIEHRLLEFLHSHERG